MALIYNATFDKNTRKLSFEDKAGNEIYSFTVPERAPTVDDITKPLTFRATQDGSTVTLKKNGLPSGYFKTSRDGGSTWTDYTIGTVITLNTGDEVSFRSRSDRTSGQSDSKYFSFEMTGKIEALHNVMSMIRTNDFATYESVANYAFYSMFYGCTSLTKAPVLPATTLAQNCYNYMFSGCGKLTKAPVLPATTLAQYCYDNMFSGCISLTKAPELPATTLTNHCYYWMFAGCQSLKEVRIAATTTATDALKDWLREVSATGDFYCDPNAKIFPSGVSGIPSGWRKLNINEEAPASVDDIEKPLTFRATQDSSTVKLSRYGLPRGSAFQTSRDGGNAWSDYTIGTAITLNTGDEVSFRAKADRTSVQASSEYFYCEMTGKIEAWHNVMSLYRTNDFATYKSVVEYAFYSLFDGCTSLTKAPILPATTLDDSCYYGMFSGCQSLTKAPELPATILALSCYGYMFCDCQSLTKAPVLPATTLPESCYYGMFSGCQSLKEVRIAATIEPYSGGQLDSWLEGVSATGDFYCDPNATIFPTDSASGIPANWTRHNIADYPN